MDKTTEMQIFLDVRQDGKSVPVQHLNGEDDNVIVLDIGRYETLANVKETLQRRFSSSLAGSTGDYRVLYAGHDLDDDFCEWESEQQYTLVPRERGGFSSTIPTKAASSVKAVAGRTFAKEVRETWRYLKKEQLQFCNPWPGFSIYGGISAIMIFGIYWNNNEFQNSKFNPFIHNYKRMKRNNNATAFDDS